MHARFDIQAAPRRVAAHARMCVPWCLASLLVNVAELVLLPIPPAPGASTMPAKLGGNNDANGAWVPLAFMQCVVFGAPFFLANHNAYPFVVAGPLAFKNVKQLELRFRNCCVGLLCANAFISAISVAQIRSISQPVLVQWGFFSVARHPISMGTVLLLFGFSFAAPIWPVFISVASICAHLRQAAVKEDLFLGELFGAEHAQYVRDVDAVGTRVLIIAFIITLAYLMRQ